MKIEDVHPFQLDVKAFSEIQQTLARNITLTKLATSTPLCAGVDVAYWDNAGNEWGVCSIVVVDYKTKAIIEKVDSYAPITVPYIPGYLAFRELPLILEAAKKLTHTPDLFMFDGNGYLHPRHMGIATHAAFFLNKPTIGIAKSYFKIADVDYKMPVNQEGGYEDIMIGNKIYGRVIRTHKDVLPIFISSGNYIDLQTTTAITMHFIHKESKIPIPVRLADVESRRLKRLNNPFL